VLVAQVALSGPTYPPVPDQAVTQELQAVANRLGSGNLAPNATAPSTADVVETTRGEALSASSGDTDNLDPGATVYMVQLQGTFVGCMAKVPDPTSVTGQGLVFIFDPASGQLTDWGIEQNPIDLAALGQVSSIAVSLSAVPCTELPPSSA